MGRDGELRRGRQVDWRGAELQTWGDQGREDIGRVRKVARARRLGREEEF